ncbi:MAG TPA: choice-of-anchor Q domain-containing protein, partial [Rhodanobacteraceae bacterium]|nr:choice-of-anchor Q domain-containing protein [Rhodanobacteraceae bacterium]
NAYAGGGFAAGGLTVKYSNFTGNTAFTASDSGSAYYALGGGLFAFGGFIQNTTFDYNAADAGGGVYLRAGTSPATFSNSTISSNHAALLGGAMFSAGDIELHNCTIAFNLSGPRGGGGVLMTGANAELVSTIVANNSPSGTDGAADFDGGGVVVSGSNNLVKISGVAMPGDTITEDPQLLPLAWNGGETRTHAIPATSPAHDAGLNPDGYDFDQRGHGYPRVDDTDPDIGAYELNPDIIFVDGFGGA